jgi:hypothetical protein
MDAIRRVVGLVLVYVGLALMLPGAAVMWLGDWIYPVRGSQPLVREPGPSAS